MARAALRRALSPAPRSTQARSGGESVPAPRPAPLPDTAPRGRTGAPPGEGIAPGSSATGGRARSIGPAPRDATAVGYLRRSTDRQEQSIPDQQKAVERFAEERGLSISRFYVDDAISGTSTAGRRAFQALIADAGLPARDFAFVICYDVKRFGRVDNDEAGYYRHILKSHGVEVLYASENFTGDGTDDLLRPVKQWQARQESKDLAKVTIRGLLSKAGSAGPSKPRSGEARGARAAGGASGGAPGSASGTSGGGGGWWMGGAPPYGYDLRYESQSGEGLFTLRYLSDGSKRMLDDSGALVRTLGREETVAVSRRDRCRLVPGEALRVGVVRLIFRLYVEERRGFKTIADRLNRMGPAKAPTARGPEWSSRYSGEWATGTIRAVLMNPAYKGDMVWNRRTDGRFFRIANGMAVERRGVQGRRLAPNQESDWIVAENAHAALLPRRVWEKARSLREGLASSIAQSGVPKADRRPFEDRSGGGGWKGPRAKFLLSGLCVCSACGSRYEGVTQPSTKRDQEDGPSGRSLAYACGGYIRRGKSACTRGAIPRDAVERAVCEGVTGFYARYGGEAGRRRLLEEFERVFGVEREGAIRRRAQLGLDLERLETTVRNLLDNLTKANKEAVDRRLAEIESEREAIEREMQALDRAALSRKEAGALARETAAFLDALPGLLGGGAHEERQAALRRCVARVGVRRSKAGAVEGLTLELRSIPTIIGGPEEASTAQVEAALAGVRCARGPGQRRGGSARAANAKA